MSQNLLVALVVSLCLIAVFTVVGFSISSVWLFVPATILTFIIHLKTWHRQSPNPEQILPLYLLALAWQFLHFLEEYMTDFATELPGIFGLAPYPEDYWIAFNMVAYSFFTLGGIFLFQKRNALLVIPLLFIVIGVLLNAIGHVALAIYVGNYFPGLYTALFYFVMGPMFIRLIFK